MTIRRAAIALLAAVTAGGVVASPIGPAAAAPERSASCFVEVAYPVVLRRDPTAAEVDVEAARLLAGTSQATFVRGLARSQERSIVEVRQLYATASSGPAEPSDLTDWAARIRAGARVRDVGAAIFAAAWAEGYLDDERYVEYLYWLVLGRGGSSTDSAYWVAQLEARGREWVARRFFGAVEWRSSRVDRLYREILGRAPDAAGRTYWVDRLRTLDDIELVVKLTASSELRSRSDRACPARGATTVTATVIEPDPSAATSGDGDTVVFWTSRPLVAGDSGLSTDVYVWDRGADRLTRIPVGAQGGLGSPAVSDDGDVAVFSTLAAIVPADTDARSDVYRWSRSTGAVTLVAAGADVESTFQPDLSADGRFTAYTATVAPVGGARTLEIRLLDADTGTTTVVMSRAANDRVVSPHISADGSAVAWGDTIAGVSVVSHWDRLTGVTTSVGPDDVGGAGALEPSLSGDGSLMAFAVDGYWGRPGSGVADGVYLWDQSTGVSRREVTAETLGQVRPALSADGQVLVFSSFSNTLVADDLGGIDLFRRDLATGTTTRIVTEGVAGGAIGNHVLSSDGDHVALTSTYPGSNRRLLVVWDATPS